MKKTTNILLVFAVIIPFVLMFWPFAEWNNVMAIILRIIPSVTVQVLLCRVNSLNIVKVMPSLITGAFALWGTYLYFTSPHWNNATVSELIADYVSPFICCIVVLITYLLTKKKK